MLIKSKIPFVLSMFIFLSIPNILEAWEGEVIKVEDGDTIIVQNGGKDRIVKLNGIDAPEKSQPFGKEAEEFLANMILNKRVEVKEKGNSKDGNMLADVYVLKGYKRCVNEELLRNGLAWCDPKSSPSPKMSSIEKLARQEKRGLWADSNAIPPWEYKKSNANKEENDKVAMEKQKAFEEKFLKEYFSEEAIRARAAAASQQDIEPIPQGQKPKEKKEKKYKGCEIVSFTQHEESSGRAHVVGGYVTPGGQVLGGIISQGTHTCVDVIINNDDHDEIIIKNENIVAITDEDVVLPSKDASWGGKSWKWLKNTTREITPTEGSSIRIAPEGTYKGTICFGRRLPQIVKMEYRP